MSKFPSEELEHIMLDKELSNSCMFMDDCCHDVNYSKRNCRLSLLIKNH